MIVLCPKAFSSNDGFSHERDFLKYFLSKNGKKATLANEIWETFRFRVNSQNNNEISERIIADFRGIFKPEEMDIDENHLEVEAKQEFPTKELIEKTKDLLLRRWADINIFITTNPEEFKEITEEKKIETLTLQEFFIGCMEQDRNRKILEEYWGKIQREKWG